MSESNGNYWSKHHTGIIQCVLGLYCAVFATWEHWHPLVTPAAVAHNASERKIMSNSYSMPFWLWAGIVGLALSVIIPAVTKIIRNRRHAPPKLAVTIDLAKWGPRPEDVRDVTNRVRGAFEKSGQVEVSTYALRDPFKGETKRLWVTYSITKTVEVPEEHPTPRLLTLASLETTQQQEIEKSELEKLFSPLQIEAFQLAKDMREFLASLPAPSSTEDRIQWRKNLRYGYELKFPDRQKNLLLRLGENGVRQPQFPPKQIEIRLEERIRWEAALFTVMAHRLEGTRLKVEADEA